MARFEKVAEIDERMEDIKNPKVKEDKNSDRIYVSTGATLLNLALSDHIDRGYPLGRIIHLIGDSSTGKTLLALTMMAEATINKSLDKHHLIYDETEAGMEFNLEDMFGKNMKRLKFWPTKRDKPRTTQDWHDDLLRTIVKEKKNIVYVLDSYDALNVEEELGEEASLKKGGWKTGKAIASSETLRKICGMGEGTNSVLVVISQTRVNLGANLFGPKKTVSGGDAWKFYSTVEIWLHNGPKITKKVRGVEEEIGHYVIAKMGKNRLTGKKRVVMFPVYYSYGVDDVRSMIEWLLAKGFWEYVKEEEETEDGEKKKKKKKTEVIDTCGDFINAKIPELIKYIEDNNLEQKLKEVTGESWNILESEIEDVRKPRYI